MIRMRDLNQYILNRNGLWYYQRRIPKIYSNYDKRRFAKVSLMTDSLIVARKRRDVLVEADNQFWASLKEEAQVKYLGIATDHITVSAITRYDEAKQRALKNGFDYATVENLTQRNDLEDLFQRLLHVARNPENEAKEVEAVLGGVKAPIVTISQAHDIYCNKIAISELVGKSESQIASWKKVKLRAVSNFIKICGDLPMDKITRKDARKFYDWWGKRLIPSDECKPLTSNSANRDMGNVRKLYTKYWEFEGDEDRSNPFRKLSFGKHGLKDIPHFEDDFVRTRLLNPDVFQGFNFQAVTLLYAMIETGCRPSELSSLTAENIILHHEVPHIKIRPASDRQLKSKSSVRDIPLVGVALIAMQLAPEGFPHYKDKGNLLSASMMKAFRARQLFPTPDHRIYSFRHSFEKRMLEGGLDYGLRCLLMGHHNSRPSYGDGGSLEYRRNELLKIKHPVPKDFKEKLTKLS